MDKALPIIALSFGTVITAVALVDLLQYRKFRQYYVDSGWLPGTKTGGK